MTFLLYGAYGYTGRLIARAAKDYGLTPVLAGRNKSKLQEMGMELELDYRVFDLEDTGALYIALEEFPVVLHCAGPFSHTAEPMMKACIATGTHYLDITGEIDVFELAHTFDEAAKSANIMLMSGVGFDVVPTDCMAAYLKEQMPDATHLKLAFMMINGGVSHGTAMTMVENLGEASKVRQDGTIIDVPVGHKTMELPFETKRFFFMTIPWGDVSTAYYTTGIPNIETYTGVPPKTHQRLKYAKYINWLLRNKLVRSLVKRQVDKRPAGPTDAEREKAQTFVWGEVRNAKGERREARMVGPEGYTITFHMALNITKKVLEGNYSTGFQTPAGAYGADLILEMEDTFREDPYC